MLKTYFFIPAHKTKYFENIKNLNASKFVLDFEDAFAENNIESALENISDIADFSQFYIRPRLIINGDEVVINHEKKLFYSEFRNFVLPKISSVNHLNCIYEAVYNKIGNKISDYKFIILIENPLALINIKEILSFDKLNIAGVGLGSHDYANAIGMRHELENLYYARNVVLNHAKAYDLVAIDIASMNISDEEEFNKEVKSAFDLGFDAKFIIHPFQLNLVNAFQYYSDAETEEANAIYELIKDDLDDLSAINFNGRVIEKPHILKILKIVEWRNNAAKQAR